MVITQLAPTREIDGLTFQVDMLSLDKATEVFANAAQFMGPSLLNVVAKIAAGKGLGDLDSAVALGELGKVLAELSPEKLKYFRDSFALCSRVDLLSTGKFVELKPVMATVLRGRIGTMLKWIWFAFQVNFNDFLGDALATFRQQPAQPSPEPSASESPMG